MNKKDLLQCNSKFKRTSRFSSERVSSLVLVSFCEFYKLKAKNKSTCTSLKKRSFVEAEAVTRSCCVKKVFLKILQNSQLNTSRPATLLKKRLWQSCFLVSFVNFFRTPFLTEHILRLLLWKEFLNVSLIMIPKQFFFLACLTPMFLIKRIIKKTQCR